MFEMAFLIKKGTTLVMCAFLGVTIYPWLIKTMTEGKTKLTMLQGLMWGLVTGVCVVIISTIAGIF